MANTVLEKKDFVLLPRIEENRKMMQQGLELLLENYTITLDAGSQAYVRNTTDTTLVINPVEDAHIMLVMQQHNQEGRTKESTPRYTVIEIKDQDYIIWYSPKK